MDKMLRGTEEYATGYIYDVIIYSMTWEDHLRHLANVFQKLAAAGLTVNPVKCSIAKSEVSYLGYVLGNQTTGGQG